jgi:hypothetical protein
MLLEIVKNDCALLVILLSGEYLRRPWCAGEVVAAMNARVAIRMLASKACHEASFTGEFIESVPNIWNTHDVRPLAAAGVHVPDIKEAYTILSSIEYMSISEGLHSEDDVDNLFRICDELVAPSTLITACSIMFTRHSRKTAVVSSVYQIPQLFILLHQADSENVATGYVLSFLILRSTGQKCQLLFEQSDITQVPAGKNSLVVLLTCGILDRAPWFQLLHAANTCLQPESFVPVFVTGGKFEFPSKSDLAERVSPSLTQSAGCCTQEKSLELLHEIFSVIALPLSVCGSESSLNSEVRLILRKVEHFHASPEATRSEHHKEQMQVEQAEQAPGLVSESSFPGLPADIVFSECKDQEL